MTGYDVALPPSGLAAASHSADPSVLNRASLSDTMREVVDPLRVMQRVTDRVLELIPHANGAMVGLADDDGITYVCGGGTCVSFIGTNVDLETSLSGLAVRSGLILRSDDTGCDPRVDAEACRRLSVVSLVCIPLSRGSERLGVLAVNAARPHAFSEQDLAVLTRLADFVGVAIGLASDLSRVSEDLLRFGLTEDPATDTASRFVMDVLSPDTITRIDERRRVQQVLEDPERLSVVFQPIVDLRSGQSVALEALARFDITPVRSPDLWFSDAHHAGLGVELEMLAITHALAQEAMFPDGVAMTINAGPETTASPLLYEALLHVPARRVIIELTEHVAMDDFPGLSPALRALRRRGVRIAVDDAGSGYSSLSHILKLAPDFIKLDRELISGIDLDPVRRALASSLVTFAGETGAEIVAEGVENEDELEVLRRLGVRYAQGYHLARPAPLAALTLHH
jgi:EAL domain-containing protein (putative c-di-GMP-specific phosphodiesterase class I)